MAFTMRLIGQVTNKSVKLGQVGKSKAVEIATAIAMASNGTVLVKLYENDDAGYTVVEMSTGGDGVNTYFVG